MLVILVGQATQVYADNGPTGDVDSNGTSGVAQNNDGRNGGVGGGGGSNGSSGGGSSVTCTGTPYGQISGRSGTPGGGTSFTQNDGSVWVVGDLSCSDGYSFGAYCVLNCPVGTAAGFVQLPTLGASIAMIPWQAPEARFSPELEKVRNGNVGGYLPGFYMFAAATPASWQTLTTHNAIGPNHIDVTATPVRFVTTIDGERAECPGPGRIVSTGEQYDDAKASDTCKHLFTEAGDHPATVAIIYHITWTSNFNVQPTGTTAGDAGERQGPTTNYNLPVHEVQAVNR